MTKDRIFMFLHIFTESMQLLLNKLSQRFIFLSIDIRTFLEHKKSYFKVKEYIVQNNMF
jgi:hypothetical protein